MKYAESPLDRNQDEAGLYPSVIGGGRLLEAVFDLAQGIWERMEHSTESEWRPFQDHRHRSRRRCRNDAYFLCEESEQACGGKLLVDEYTERNVDSVPRYYGQLYDQTEHAQARAYHAEPQNHANKKVQMICCVSDN
jgi:hypothetical protein